jgi:transposase InsO family protein
LVEQRVVAFALGHPGFGPARVAAELARPTWGGISMPTNGVWRVLRRHGLHTRAKRYGLVAGYAAPPGPQRPTPAPERHLDVDHPGQLVQLGCCCTGRLSGTKGTVRQDAAIDVASAYAWATLQVTRRNPQLPGPAPWPARWPPTRSSRGWRLERVMSDDALGFRSATFQATIAELGARHAFIRAGRPQTNGCVERVQQAILDGCWKPAFARYLIPKQTGLRLDLGRYLRYYDTERAHTGRWTRGRTPDQVLGKAKLWHKGR